MLFLFFLWDSLCETHFLFLPPFFLPLDLFFLFFLFLLWKHFGVVFLGQFFFNNNNRCVVFVCFCKNVKELLNFCVSPALVLGPGPTKKKKKKKKKKRTTTTTKKKRSHTPHTHHRFFNPRRNFDTLERVFLTTLRL